LLYILFFSLKLCCKNTIRFISVYSLLLLGICSLNYKIKYLLASKKESLKNNHLNRNKMKEKIESSPSVKSGWSLKLAVIRLIETPISSKPLSKGRYAVSIAQPRPTPPEKIIAYAAIRRLILDRTSELMKRAMCSRYRMRYIERWLMAEIP